jgi:hypothetical protein
MTAVPLHVKRQFEQRCPLRSHSRVTRHARGRRRVHHNAIEAEHMALK